MNTYMVLLLSLSILVVFISSWMLGTFIRLNEASNTYNPPTMIETACHLSRNYILIGRFIGIILTLSSLCFTGIILLYKDQ